MRRLLFALTVAAAAIGACDLSPSNPFVPTLVLSPVLESLFVGDSRPPRTVTLYDANGNVANPGPVTWTINPTAVATINATSGEVHGVSHGAATITARDAAGDSGVAPVVVSRPLDMTLLMDMVFLMPGDTFTIPLAIQRKDATPDTVWFDQSPSPAVYVIDTATGVVTAQSTTGGPIPYIAHVSNGTIPVADTGFVQIVTPTATAGGRFFMTVIGTAIRHEGGAAYAMNYHRANGDTAFRLTDSLISADSKVYERLMITLPNLVTAPATVTIDSMNPQQASVSLNPLNVICNPPSPWGLWSSVLPMPGIQAYSNRVYSPSGTAGPDSTGYLSITRYQSVSGGFAIGGRFMFTARRSDLYYDSLGIETIHGTFVAPLVPNETTCQQ